jgi:hypothetical protein
VTGLKAGSREEFTGIAIRTSASIVEMITLRECPDNSQSRDPCDTIPQGPAPFDPRDDGLPMSAVGQKLRTAAVIIFRGWRELARLNLHIPGRQSPLSERKGEW